jgi:hypothetical protein
MIFKLLRAKRSPPILKIAAGCEGGLHPVGATGGLDEGVGSSSAL